MADAITNISQLSPGSFTFKSRASGGASGAPTHIDQLTPGSFTIKQKAATAGPAAPKVNLAQAADQNIQKPAYDISKETSLPKTIAKTVANEAKDLASTAYGIIKAPFVAAKNVAYDIPRAVMGKGQDMGAYATPGQKTITPDMKAAGYQQPGKYPLAAKSAIVAGAENAPDVVLGSTLKAISTPAIQDLTGQNNNWKPQPAKALQDIAEKPFSNILPYAALGSDTKTGELSTGSDLVDKTIEKVGSAPGKVLGKAADVLKKNVVEPVKSGYEGVTIKTPEQKIATAEKSMTEGIQKGVKPTILGKQTLSSQAKFYDNFKTGLKTIAENRDKLEIVNADGETVNKPQTNAELSQAIDQTKKTIYDQYNSMTKAATGADAKIDVSGVVKKLENTTTNLKYSPQTRAYAKSMMAEIGELQNASPDVIEARIKDLNSNLTGYYEGRTSKAQASLDAAVASNLRELLDKKIEETQGPGYQDLKNKYGALKSMEKDVNKRAIVTARANAKNLPSTLVDAWSGAEVAGGLFTGNLMPVIKGLASKGLGAYYKNLNAPDRYIANMMNDVYDAYPSASIPASVVQPAAPAPGTAVVPAGSTPTTILKPKQ